MQYLYSGQPPYDTETLNATRAFIAAQDAWRIVWSVVMGMKDGFNSPAISHGGFA